MGENMGILKQDFLVPELQSISEAAGVSGFVTVQARQSIEETRWLLELSEQCPLIRGVVGWLPLRELDQLPKYIEQFSESEKLLGVRHVIQDEPDDAFILGEAFNQGIRALAKTYWVYDILIYAKHLENTIQFVDRHPDQVFVLDHIAKPRVSANQFDSRWATNIRELARRQNVSCKFSGVATEVVDSSWEHSTLKPYWDVAFESFGSHRMMYGSDWPVCLLATEYGRWKSCIEHFAGELTLDEQASFWSGNAERIYGIK